MGESEDNFTKSYFEISQILVIQTFSLAQSFSAEIGDKRKAEKLQLTNG